MAAAPFALPGSRRIKHGRDFQRAKTQGRRLAHGCLILNWVPLASGASSRLGVITSRKIGEAVERSRARRLLRESFRLNQRGLRGPVDVVLVARSSIVSKDLRAVQHDYLAALKRAGLLRETDSMAGSLNS